MLKQLEQRQLGLLNPAVFQKSETVRRALNIELHPFGLFVNMSSSVITAMDLSYDGKFLLCGGLEGMYSILPLPGDNVTKFHHIAVVDARKQHDYAITSCQWYPVDNGMFTTCSRDGHFHVCLMDNGAASPLEIYGPKRGSTNFFTRHHMNTLNTNKTALVCEGRNQVVLVDLRAGLEVQVLRAHGPTCGGLQASSVCWSPRDENILAIGSTMGTLSENDIRSPLQPIATFVSPYANGSIRLRHGGTFGEAHFGGILSIKYSSTGLELFSLGHDRVVNRFDTLTSKNLASVGVQDHEHACRAFSSFSLFGQNPSLLYAPCLRKLKIIDMDKAEIVKEVRLLGHTNHVVYDETRGHGYIGGDSLHMLVGYNETLRQVYLPSDDPYRAREDETPLVDMKTLL